VAVHLSPRVGLERPLGGEHPDAHRWRRVTDDGLLGAAEQRRRLRGVPEFGALSGLMNHSRG